MSESCFTEGFIYPLTKEQDERLEDSDCYSFLSDGEKGFELQVCYSDTKKECTYYLIYATEYSYGEKHGDFGFTRPLTQKEKKQWLPIFQQELAKNGLEFNPALLKYTQFCYYNGCESPDYYEASVDLDQYELWLPADGAELPEFDREVVVFCQDTTDTELLRVSMAHRPDPKSNAITYGMGKWNQPNVVLWLDLPIHTVPALSIKDVSEKIAGQLTEQLTEKGVVLAKVASVHIKNIDLEIKLTDGTTI